MLKWPEAQTVAQAVRDWAEALGRARPDVLRIGYFGSYARGDWGVGSDLDLLILVERSATPFHRRGVEWDVSGLPVPADVLVYTKAEWQALEREGGRFQRAVTGETVWVYVRDGEQRDPSRVRQRLQRRREAHRKTLRQEVERLTRRAAALGVQRVILFGSLAQREAGLTSDLDLLIVWDTPLGFLERTVELYRRLQPRVAADLLVYTPAEMERMAATPLVRLALQEGRVLYEA